MNRDWKSLSRDLRGALGERGTIVVGVILAAIFLAAGGPLMIAGASMSITGVGVFAAILVGPALWVLSDARRRGMAHAFLWGLFALLGNVVGLIVYLLVRDERRSIRPCETCGRPVGSDHAACPYCGALARSSKRSCQNCRNELELDWRFCPYCRTEAGGPTAA